jgi:hypothetical protein
MQTGEMITTPQPPPTFILLNGFPCIGKYTTARALKSSLADQYPFVPTILVDNHFLLGPVVAVYSERDLAYYTFRRKNRGTEFLQLKDIDPKTILIMTTLFSHEREYDSELFWDYVELAKARGVEMVYINLFCGDEENGIRMWSKERRKGREMGVKGELVDVGILRELK